MTIKGAEYEILLLFPDDTRERNLSPATGKTVAGDFPAQTSWPGIEGHTVASNPTGISLLEWNLRKIFKCSRKIFC